MDCMALRACVKNKFLESIDVAFVICNNSYDTFGPKKFEDIVCQIFPSAIVLGTAYWPFYRDSNNQFLCICKHYGFVCKHTKSIDSVHCINTKLNTSEFNNTSTFLFSGEPVKPLKYHFTLLPTPDTMLPGFLISVRIDIKAEEEPMKLKTMNRIPKETFHINTCLTFTPRFLSLSPGYKYMPAPYLKKNADPILELRESYTFPDYVVDGYDLEEYTITKWCLRTSLTDLTDIVPVLESPETSASRSPEGMVQLFAKHFEDHLNLKNISEIAENTVLMKMNSLNDLIKKYKIMSKKDASK